MSEAGVVRVGIRSISPRPVDSLIYFVQQTNDFSAARISMFEDIIIRLLFLQIPELTIFISFSKTYIPLSQHRRLCSSSKPFELKGSAN